MKSLSLNQPHLIIMVGVPGSGKTFFAEKFAATFGAPYISRDVIMSLLKDPFAITDDLLYHQIEELLKTRQSIIVEGITDTRAERLELAKLAHTAGYETLLVWVQTEPATAKNRHKKDNKPTKARSSEEYDRLAKRFSPPSSIEKLVVISGKHTYATQAKVILKKLSEPRAAEVSATSVAPTRSEPTKSASRRHNITIR